MKTLSIVFNSPEQASGARNLAETEAHGSSTFSSEMPDDQRVHLSVASAESDYWAEFLLRQPGCRTASFSISGGRI